MDFKQIQDLIKLVNRTNLAELSIEKDDFKIKLRTKEGIAARNAHAEIAYPVQTHIQPTAQPQPQASSAPESAAKNTPAENTAKAPVENNYVEVRSPMVGTFYRSPGPEKEAFVKIGDDVKEGEVLCIIEAMKLFNEIESEVSGKVVKVLIDDASPVEYNQPLFLVEPKG